MADGSLPKAAPGSTVGGIALTASHNPAHWNALKLASDRGMFLTPDEGADVLSMVAEDRIPRAYA